MLERFKAHRKARRLQRIAKEKFGYQKLRPGQEEAIKSILDGHDTLAVLPTGLGKSMIYQISALMLQGPTVVVSPLIALQRDQVESIEELEVGEAAQVNSTMKESERQKVLEALRQGKLEFLFLAPEQFSNEELLARLAAVAPSLFVIDEAHCISEWGHDFRPEYLRLGDVIERLGHPVVLALTATASPPVREEIVARLKMRDANVVVRGFDRPNIWLGVEAFQDETSKRHALVERVRDADKPGIVYAATRKHAEEVSAALSEQGVKAAFYHAGMRASERELVQSQFMADEIEVIVATTAFGMGIDKPNVRFVFHYDISDSIDSYYQEIGRAGRDGEEALAILFYRSEDLGIRRFFAGVGRIDADQVQLVAQAVQAIDRPVVLQELGDATHLSRSKLAEALNRLEEVGVVEMLPNGEVIAGTEPENLAEVAEVAIQAHESHRLYEKSRIEMMSGYAEVDVCRREFVLNYFGEKLDAPCGFCDNCAMGIAIEGAQAEAPFPLSARVTHASWGPGLVMRYEGDKMVVLFDQVGYKTLAIEIVIERGLLQLIS